jgi:hypothetical protein
MQVTLTREDIIKTYPDGPSAVVHARHGSVWQGEVLATNAIRQMLDASITKLTGLNDARQAWATLFDPGERVAIKVNTLRYSVVSTHLPLVLAVTERLQEIGIPPEQIVIFDRETAELENAIYPLNLDGPGVRCYGTDGRYTGGWSMLGDGVQLTDILLNCDALINMPLLKVHGDGSGITFSLKNHYGTFDRPEDYHHERMGRGMAELNALPPIRERTRLLIGDALRVVKAGWSQWVYGDAIYMGFDPVALDTIGLQEIHQVLTKEGLDTRQAEALARPWLTSSAAMGLGTDDPAHIELREIAL